MSYNNLTNEDLRFLFRTTDDDELRKELIRRLKEEAEELENEAV